MDKKLKEKYLAYVHDSAPDMENLWQKIDSKVENSQVTKQRRQNGENNTINIESRKSKFKIGKILAMAAAVTLVVIGGYNYIDSYFSKNSLSDKAAINKNDAAENENNAYTEKAEIKVQELQLASTDTPDFMDYTAEGDEYFVSAKVLGDTEFMTDVTVLNVQIDVTYAVYTLKVNSTDSKSGENIGDTITIKSSSPYILQKNRRYFIPLKSSADGYEMVFENAPSIEITLDNKILYPNCWGLDENAVTVKENQKRKNDYYYDRMVLSNGNILEDLIDEWKQV